MARNPIPVVVLSHRKTEFLETTIKSIRARVGNIGPIVVVDDSGCRTHYQWLGSHFNGSYSIVSYGENAGYLEAMKTVFTVALELTETTGSDYVLLWEEDFVVRKSFDAHSLAAIMDLNPGLANLNLQRQAVYRVERTRGYLESHVLRGYDLTRECSDGALWVSRMRPFTTNPGLIRKDILEIEWPTREESDQVSGGAEPAMSLRLEADKWYFGWYGKWNQPSVHHVGRQQKTGTGY